MSAVYIYCRFSSAKQEKGDSLERQQRDNRAYCLQNGWEIAGEFADAGISAWKGNNLTSGQLGIFANKVRSAEIPSGSILCVEKLDRLSRQDVWAAVDWMREMTRLGLTVVTSMDNGRYDQQSLSSDNPAQLQTILGFFMHGIVANQLSETISKRVKSAWVRNRTRAGETNRVISAHCPGWLEVVGTGEDREFRPIPKRAALVREIFELAASGVGAPAIMRTFNERGEKPWGRAYHHRNSHRVGWEHSYIRDIINSSAVEGDLEPGRGRRRNREKTGERIVGYFPRIVDADLVARARAAQTSRKGTGGRGRDQCANLFSGFTTCGHCGGGMTITGSGGKAGRYLMCINASRGRGCEQKRLFPYKAFEPAALDAVLPLALDDRYFQRPDVTQKLSVELAETKRTIDMKKDAVKNLARQLAVKDSETIRELVDEAEADIATLRQMAKELEKALHDARGSVSAQEHLQRVLEVRGALDHEDYETRLKARRMVTEALRGIDAKVVCSLNEGEKEIVLTVLEKAASFLFDGAGNLITKIDVWQMFSEAYDRLSPDQWDTLQAYMDGDGAIPLTPERQEKLAAYLRRRAAA